MTEESLRTLATEASKSRREVIDHRINTKEAAAKKELEQIDQIGELVVCAKETTANIRETTSLLRNFLDVWTELKKPKH